MHTPSPHIRLNITDIDAHLTQRIHAVRFEFVYVFQAWRSLLTDHTSAVATDIFGSVAGQFQHCVFGVQRQQWHVSGFDKFSAKHQHCQQLHEQYDPPFAVSVSQFGADARAERSACLVITRKPYNSLTSLFLQ
jgi:hypothetical protein